MRVRRLWLTEFRNYESADLELGPGLTAVVGANGQGKTNLVEALAYLARLSSFREAPLEALIRDGFEAAVIRADIVHNDGREVLIEAELSRRGRQRVQVNRQRLTRSRDMVGLLRVSIFSPDDLELVKGAPAGRRGLLDDTLVALDPKVDRLLSDVERTLRQRGALLKQVNGRLVGDDELTLDIWDSRLAEFGMELGRRRRELVGDLIPLATAAYQVLARRRGEVMLAYEPAWLADGLATALRDARRDDLRRQVTTVGPHRDDLDLVLNALPARTTASQGESRCLAYSLRLAAHQLVTLRHGETPVLVLDDVFSELDTERSSALLGNLPPGQVIITTASALPADARPEQIISIDTGRIIQ